MAKEIIEAEVKTNIGEVAEDTKKLNKQLNKTVETTEELEGAGKKGATGFKKLKTAVVGFGLALKAIGIGLIIGAFVSLKEALSRNQDAVDLYNTSVTAISTTFNQVVEAIVDVVVWVTSASERFDGLGKVIKGVVTIGMTPLKITIFGVKAAILELQLAWEKSYLGNKDPKKIKELTTNLNETRKELLQIGLDALNAGGDIVDNFGDAITEIGDIYDEVAKNLSKISIKGNIEQAKATTEANKSAKLAEARIQGLIEKNDRLAELQRQIRDDESKTFAERIAANTELANILDKQEKEMLKLSDTRVNAAKLEADANKDNVDLQVAYQQALNDRAAVEAQIAGFRSEQLTNQVSLEKELLQSQQEVAQEGLSGIAKELLELENAYEEKKKMAIKSGMEITEIEKQYDKQKAAIIRAGVTTQLDAYAELAGALKTLAGENKQLAIAEAIIATWSAATKALDAPAPLNFINMAAVLAAGFANVQKIMQTDVGTGGGGSVPSGSLSTPAPEMLSGKFTLGNVQEQQPIQAYVVTDSLTDNQNKLAYIRRRATI